MMELKTTFFNRDLKRINLFLLILIITSSIFFVDMFTPIEWAIWLFYTIPLLLVSRLFRTSGVYIFAGVCSVLIIAAYLIPPLPASPVNIEITLFNSFMGVGALWVMSLLLVRYRKADEAAREMDEKFRAMVEDSRVATFLVQDDHFVYFNPSLRELYGYSETELENISFLELVSPNDQAAMRGMLSTLAGGGMKKVAIEVQGIKKSGELMTIEIIGFYAVFKNKPALIGSIVDMSWAKLTRALFKD